MTLTPTPLSTPTPELGLQKAVDADDTEGYLTTGLANSLTTIDSLFNNSTGHTHGGVHQGGPISSIPVSAIPDGSITSAKITDGTIQAIDIGTGALTTAVLADGAVTAAKIAAQTITASQIANNTIGNSQLVGGTASINVGPLSGALTGNLPNPSLAAGAALGNLAFNDINRFNYMTIGPSGSTNSTSLVDLPGTQSLASVPIFANVAWALMCISCTVSPAQSVIIGIQIDGTQYIVARDSVNVAGNIMNLFGMIPLIGIGGGGTHLVKFQWAVGGGGATATLQSDVHMYGCLLDTQR